MIGADDCGAVSGMNEVHVENLLHCAPQIPIDFTRDRTRAAAVGNHLSYGKVNARK
jgi:hypothetical protein